MMNAERCEGCSGSCRPSRDEVLAGFELPEGRTTYSVEEAAHYLGHGEEHSLCGGQGRRSADDPHLEPHSRAGGQAARPARPRGEGCVTNLVDLARRAGLARRALRRHGRRARTLPLSR